jgi:hypothetical protein
VKVLILTVVDIVVVTCWSSYNKLNLILGCKHIFDRLLCISIPIHSL